MEWGEDPWQDVSGQEVDTDADSGELPPIENFCEGMERRDGFFVSYWDGEEGKLFLEIQGSRGEFLYVHGLATGLGSNPVGLDRGQLGGQRVVHFRRVGRKVLLVQPNLRYRARSAQESERLAVRQSFAESIIWGTEVVAQTDDRYLVDLESLLLGDVHGVVETLARTGQGEYQLDPKRSAVFFPRWQAFPRNLELEATLTFATRQPGPLVRQTAPTAEAVTLRQHHSLIALPEPGYRPRRFDPRAPSMAITFADYATALDQPLEQRWILRHRLEKKDPTAAVSEPVEPIVYYVDPGAPPQVRAALIEGASWWSEAFEAAGFKDAFRVEVLPADADPMDVRFNVIQWVHRSTRGWSYGGSVIDPRTGEILKGHVTLGSLRVRQDRLLMESLYDNRAAAGQGASPDACGAGMNDLPMAVGHLAADPVEIALARIRQLSAHEVGHTLGFVHNFAASTYDGRASVMDYPAPLIRVNPAGQFDFSNAYAVGIGSWDKLAVRFAYSQFSESADDSVELDRLLDDAVSKGMVFVTDADSRPPHAAHPLGNLWDNGSDPLSGWETVWKVRRQALVKFDRKMLPPGLDAADVEQYLVPVYLYHRYQLQAVGKLIGGVTFQYGTADDPSTRTRPVPLAEQLRAVEVIWSLLRPDSLKLPPEVGSGIGVKSYTQLRDQETFSGRTGGVFDILGPARVGVRLALDELLQPERLTRWAMQHAESDRPLIWLLQATVQDAWRDVGELEAIDQQLSQLVRGALLARLLELAEDAETSMVVRAAAVSAIESHTDLLQAAEDPREEAFRKMLRRRVWQFRNLPAGALPDDGGTVIPPGSPIGGGNR